MEELKLSMEGKRLHKYRLIISLYHIKTKLERKLEKKTRVRENKAVYTAILVACGWAGAVVSLCKPQNSKIRE